MARKPAVEDPVLSEPEFEEFLRDYKNLEANVLAQKSAYDQAKAAKHEYCVACHNERRLSTPDIIDAHEYERGHTHQQCFERLKAHYLVFKLRGVFDQGSLVQDPLEREMANDLALAPA
jgi:hypothetical protein